MRVVSPRILQLAGLVLSVTFFSAVAQASLPNTSSDEKKNLTGRTDVATASSSDDEDAGPAVLPKDGKLVFGSEEDEFFIITPDSSKKLRLAAEKAEREHIQIEASKSISLEPYEIAKSVTYIDPTKNVNRLVHSVNTQAKKANGLVGPLSALSDPFVHWYPEDVGLDPKTSLLALHKNRPTQVKSVTAVKPKKVARKPAGSREFDAAIGKKQVVRQAANPSKNLHSIKKENKKKKQLQTSENKAIKQPVAVKPLTQAQPEPSKKIVTKKLAKKVKWRRDVKHRIGLPGQHKPVQTTAKIKPQQDKLKKTAKLAQKKATHAKTVVKQSTKLKQHAVKKPKQHKLKANKLAEVKVLSLKEAKRLTQHVAKPTKHVQRQIAKKAEKKPLHQALKKNTTAKKVELNHSRKHVSQKTVKHQPDKATKLTQKRKSPVKQQLSANKRSSSLKKVASAP